MVVNKFYDLLHSFADFSLIPVVDVEGKYSEENCINDCMLAEQYCGGGCKGSLKFNGLPIYVNNGIAMFL